MRRLCVVSRAGGRAPETRVSVGPPLGSHGRDPALPAVHRIRTRPRGRVIVSVYSSGAIGRLVPEDVIGLIKYVREHEAEEQAA
jgi:hypothetical protein